MQISFKKLSNTDLFLFFSPSVSILDASCIAFGIYRIRSLFIFLSLTDLSTAISPLIISSPVTIHVTKDLSNTETCRTADILPGTGVPQQHDTNSGTQFHSTGSVVFMTNSSAHICADASLLLSHILEVLSPPVLAPLNPQ